MEIVTEHIGQALYDFFSVDADAVPLIGTRIYPMTIPQTAELPAAAYQIISKTEIMDHDGESKLRTARIQFTCQARSYESLTDVASMIADKLRGYKGRMGDIWVECGEVLNEFDGYGSVGNVFTRRVDVALMYRN